jgi:hypothetical protein
LDQECKGVSEEAPEYFGTKRRLSLKNENNMCDNGKKQTVEAKQTTVDNAES